MHFATFFSLAAFSAIAAAISVTSPTNGEDVNFSTPTTVKWTSVSTDRDNIAIILVDNTHYPPVHKTIANNVPTADGSYTIPPMPGIHDGSGYQINLVSKTPHNKGILAQSQQFNVVGSVPASGSGPPEQIPPVGTGEGEGEGEGRPTGPTGPNPNFPPSPTQSPPSSGPGEQEQEQPPFPPCPNGPPCTESLPPFTPSDTLRPPPTFTPTRPYPTGYPTGQHPTGAPTGPSSGLFSHPTTIPFPPPPPGRSSFRPGAGMPGIPPSGSFGPSYTATHLPPLSSPTNTPDSTGSGDRPSDPMGGPSNTDAPLVNAGAGSGVGMAGLVGIFVIGAVGIAL